jgi:hypothetical protein
VEQTHKDTSAYATLEKQYEEVIREVRDLEGTLADYNLATDKVRSSTEPSEVKKSYFLSLLSISNTPVKLSLCPCMCNIDLPISESFEREECP